MWFEDILLLALLGSGVFLIGIPLYKLAQFLRPPKKRNPLHEAQERFEQAKLDVQAARLDKERQKLYNQMYIEALQDEELKQDNNQQEKK
jgi:hypothetical protein